MHDNSMRLPHMPCMCPLHFSWMLKIVSLPAKTHYTIPIARKHTLSCRLILLNLLLEHPVRHVPQHPPLHMLNSSRQKKMRGSSC